MLKRRSNIPGFQEGGANVDPVSGNDVPVGSMPEEVRDDIDAKLSPGEFVLPADVVRFIGLERLMKMRDEAKKGLQRMSEIGQMGNADEVGEESNGTYEDEGFESEIDDILEEIEAEEKGRDVNEQTEVMMASGGAVGTKTGQTTTAGRPVYKTEEGDNVSELSITVPFKGFWANVPSIHNGVKYDEDQIVDMLNKGKITPTSVHESIKEAVDAAKARSAGLLDKPEMAEGGFMKSGTDLTKAPKNPVFDVRYYKNDEGSVMYITHINGKPMTPIPEGYKPVTQEEAQKVGQKAEEAAKATQASTQTNESGSYDATQLDPSVAKFLENETKEQRDERLGKINTALSNVLPAAAKAKIPGMGLVTLAQKAAGLFADQTRPTPAPVTDVLVRTPAQIAAGTTAGAESMAKAAAADAYSKATDGGLSDTFAGIAAESAAAQVAQGVDPAKAVEDAVRAAAMDAYTIDTSRGPGQTTTPSSGSSFAVSPPSVAATSPVSSTGSGIASRDLGGPEPGIDRSGSYDYGGSSYSGDTGFGTGSDYGEQDYGSFFAKGGLVNKRQYPAKKKRGKGLAAAKT